MDNTKDLIKDEISEKIIEITENLATRDGAHTVTVRKILAELGTTNRVFYNRFHNIGEVLEIVYGRAVFKMHEGFNREFSEDTDFFEYVTDVAVGALINTYDIKMQFAGYMFEHDSLTQSNCDWWTAKIRKIIIYAMEKHLIKPVDPDMLSYSIWCFCRGYNADAVGRRMSKEDAVKYFRFGFGCLLNGLKP